MIQPVLLLLWIFSLFGGPRIYYYEDVKPEAVRRAQYVLNSMLAERPEYKLYLAMDNVKLIIYNSTPLSEVLAEYCPDDEPSGDPGKYCPNDKVIVTWEHDLLKDERCGQYTLHEIAHALQHQVLEKRRADFENRLETAYKSAVSAGIWTDYHAMDTKGEFWATGVMAYFKVGWDQRVKVYIPDSAVPQDLYYLIGDVFNQVEWSAVTCK